MRSSLIIGSLLIMGYSCSASNADKGYTATEEKAIEERPLFDADSAYIYVESLMSFGPRVPNSPSHRLSGDWLTGKLRSMGWDVTEQTAELKAFDGTNLQVRNIFAQINPEKGERLLLLAHWDCRPWADKDPDPDKRGQPVPGANDGASGVGVLLEVARQLADSNKAVDILFVDAEDWGEESNEDSWAMGARYFAENPPKPGYKPRQAILLDMVGSPDARFGYEYFSSRSNPALMQKVWSKAAALGYDKYFHSGFGGAITDDHVQLISYGIPSIDIIDYRNSGGYEGFDPVWHTTADNMENISKETLRAVGETIIAVINDTE